jgi:hypothetical protein
MWINKAYRADCQCLDQGTRTAANTCVYLSDIGLHSRNYVDGAVTTRVGMWLKDEKVCFISWNSSVKGYTVAGYNSARGNDPRFENSPIISRRRETNPGE